MSGTSKQVAMGRAVTLLMVLAACGVLATAYAEGTTKVYTFNLFEQYTGRTQVFGAADGFTRTGKGYVVDVNATKTYKPDSEQYGYLSGLVFYTSETIAHEVLTIHFKDIGEKGGTFAEAEIFLRGLWDSNTDVHDFAIVGGTLGLSGASGTAIFTKVGDSTYLIQGTIFIYYPEEYLAV